MFGVAERSHVLYQAFRCFCIITTLHPHDTDAYQCMASCWRSAGDPALASRMLKSVNYAAPNPLFDAAIAGMPEAGAYPTPSVPPRWTGQYRPRMLMMGMPDSDYQFDSMYDAFCRALGNENVVEYPWKPFLHGRDFEAAAGYPCTSDWPGDPVGVEALVSQLNANEFDLVVYADRMCHTDENDVRTLMEAARDVPLVIMDTWDDGIDAQNDMLERAGRESCLLYFKRERIRSLPYAENTVAFPFGYPDQLVPETVDGPRPAPIFWTGKRLYGLRPLHLDYLSQKRLIPEPRKLAQPEYQAAIQSARIGLSLSGFGFDTVRYWEVPAHGAMLLAEKPAILIPNDFEDGKSAVFFDDLRELEEKLNHYMLNETEAAQIAAAGTEYFRTHHTTSVRAREFLGHVESQLAN